MTELREKTRKQKAELEKRMMGDWSDNDDDDDGGGDKEKEEKEGERQGSKGQSKESNEGSGCSWGMGELFMLPVLVVICVHALPW